VSLLVLLACDPGTNLVDTKPLVLALSGRSFVADDGRPLDVTATVTLSRGVATGEVAFASTAGRFEPATATLVDGAASSTFRCDVSVDARCTGRIEVSATWESLEGRRTITLQRVFRSDGRVADAGSLETDAGSVNEDAGRVDAGPVDAGRVDAGPVDAGHGSVWVFANLANTSDQQSRVALNLDGDAQPFLFPSGATGLRVRGNGFIYQYGGQVWEATPDDWSVYASGDAGGNDVLLPTVCESSVMESSSDGRWAYQCRYGDGGVFDGDTGVQLGSTQFFSALTPLGLFSIADVNVPSNSLLRGDIDRYDGDGGVYFGVWLFAAQALELHHGTLGTRNPTVVGRYAIPADAGYNPAYDSTTLAPNLSVWLVIRSANEIWEVPLEPGQPRLVFRLDGTMVSQPFAMPPVRYPDLSWAGLASRP